MDNRITRAIIYSAALVISAVLIFIGLLQLSSTIDNKPFSSSVNVSPGNTESIIAYHDFNAENNDTSKISVSLVLKEYTDGTVVNIYLKDNTAIILERKGATFTGVIPYPDGEYRGIIVDVLKDDSHYCEVIYCPYPDDYSSGEYVIE